MTGSWTAAERPRWVGGGWWLTLAISLSACSSSSSPLTTPSVVTPPTVETFDGTVTTGGTTTHRFSVSRSNGQLDITLSRLDVSTRVGLALGTPTDAGCSYLTGASISTLPGTSPQLSGTINFGDYCVSVFDVGGLPGPVSYTVTVSHY